VGIILKRRNKGDKNSPTVSIEKIKGDLPSVGWSYEEEIGRIIDS
jgi:hypothetical protein